jgi:hypothetical protein
METSILVFIVEDEQPIRDLLEEALETAALQWPPLPPERMQSKCLRRQRPSTVL